MRVKAEQLASHLRRGLAPVYLVSGDEPLQAQEACDAVRAAARAQGYGERIIFNAGTGFDWAALTQSAQNLSLFAERKLIELRLPGIKPGETGAAALLAYAQATPPDVILLLTCPKLDAAAQKTKWVSALDEAGVLVQVWPVEARAMPGWVAARMRARGMQPGEDAVELLAARVEGNLLAAAQDIEKLYLLYGAAPVTADAVHEAVADSARFDVYTLVDAALAGDAARAVRVLNGLRAEAEEPALILWALAREVRALAAMAYDNGKGMGTEQILARHKVWEKRKPLIKQAMQRHKTRAWWRLLRRAAHAERVIKGFAPGRSWDELLALSLGVAGVTLRRARA
ncbi:MAG: DNA polymerase III subunit delta [Gammaproteobacteria bacterium]|nr:MAG: DNA polymerase III subunit delta [Gammaproteobacteria bacterium]